MTEPKKDLVASFKKENAKTKYILISAATFLIASFLPWISVFGVGVSGWNGLTSLGNLSAIATLALWTLPKFKIELGDLSKKTDLAYKALSAVMAGSVIFFILQAQFEFNIFGIGAYLGMISAGAAVYFSFTVQKSKNNTPSK
jgi:hypothetical protein